MQQQGHQRRLVLAHVLLHPRLRRLPAKKLRTVGSICWRWRRGGRWGHRSPPSRATTASPLARSRDNIDRSTSSHRSNGGGRLRGWRQGPPPPRCLRGPRRGPPRAAPSAPVAHSCPGPAAPKGRSTTAPPLGSRSRKHRWRRSSPPPEYWAGQLRFAAADDPEDFPGQRAVMLASFNNVIPVTDDFAEAWSRSEAKEATERAPSWRRPWPRPQLRRATAEGGSQGREFRRRQRLHRLV